METGTQILQNTGNANLAYGTGGGLGTGAPTGVLDINKDNGFDTLARYQMLKKKEEYDAMKNEADALYKSAKELDLSTDALLENDRKELVDNFIPKITNYLIAHPYALNPKTPEQIKENIEIKKYIDDFKDAKAKAQVRYTLKPSVDKAIAENVNDREGMASWYNPQFEKPLGYVTPYKKLYNFDWNTLKGDSESTALDVYDGNNKIKTAKSIDTNLNTTFSKVLSKVNEGDKNFNNYVNDLYNSYLDANSMVLQEKAALVQAGKPEEAAKVKPYLSSEINVANNYITDYNTLHPNNPKPLFPVDKPLNKTQFALLNGVIANVKQDKIATKEELSDIYEQYTKLVTASKRASSKGVSRDAQDYAVSALTPFIREPNEILDMYDNPDSVYVNEAVANKPIYFNEKPYPKIEVHKKGNRVFAKVDGKIIEYNGNDWVEVESAKVKPLSIDDKIIKGQAPSGGVFKEATLDGDKIKLTYEVKDEKGAGKEVPVYVNRMDYLKGIADSKGGFDATMNWFEENNITNLNDDAQFQKAIRLIIGKPEGPPPSAKGGKPEVGKPNSLYSKWNTKK